MSTTSYNETQLQTDERYRSISLFLYHAVIAALCLMLLWFSEGSRSILPVVITMGWVSLLLIQGVRVFMRKPDPSAVEREWQRYYGGLPSMDKTMNPSLRSTHNAYSVAIEEDVQSRRVSGVQEYDHTQL